MTQQYDSKESALLMGMLMTGRSDLYKNGDSVLGLDDVLRNPCVHQIHDVIEQFGYIHEDCTVLEFDDERAVPVRIASTKFRGGYDLWIINPKSGMGMRV